MEGKCGKQSDPKKWVSVALEGPAPSGPLRRFCLPTLLLRKIVLQTLGTSE